MSDLVQMEGSDSVFQRWEISGLHQVFSCNVSGMVNILPKVLNFPEYGQEAVNACATV